MVEMKKYTSLHHYVTWGKFNLLFSTFAIMSYCHSASFSSERGRLACTHLSGFAQRLLGQELFSGQKTVCMCKCARCNDLLFALFRLRVQITHLNNTKIVWRRNKSSKKSPNGIQPILVNDVSNQTDGCWIVPSGGRHCSLPK